MSDPLLIHGMIISTHPWPRSKWVNWRMKLASSPSLEEAEAWIDRAIADGWVSVWPHDVEYRDAAVVGWANA